jgi:hypothetical protein
VFEKEADKVGQTFLSVQLAQFEGGRDFSIHHFSILIFHASHQRRRDRHIRFAD